MSRHRMFLNCQHAWAWLCLDCSPPACPQLVTMVAEGGRLAIPQPEELPGPGSGSFEGMPAYVALMQRCWAQDPAGRPSFEDIGAALA